MSVGIGGNQYSQYTNCKIQIKKDGVNLTDNEYKSQQISKIVFSGGKNNSQGAGGIANPVTITNDVIKGIKIMDDWDWDNQFNDPNSGDTVYFYIKDSALYILSQRRMYTEYGPFTYTVEVYMQGEPTPLIGTYEH